MASCQEGQAYSVAGLARNTASASTANLTTTFFMTIFLVRLFYSSEPERQARGCRFALARRSGSAILIRRIQVVQHPVHHHAGDGHIQPERQGPAGDADMAWPAIAQSLISRE